MKTSVLPLSQLALAEAHAARTFEVPALAACSLSKQMNPPPPGYLPAARHGTALVRDGCPGEVMAPGVVARCRELPVSFRWINLVAAA